MIKINIPGSSGEVNPCPSKLTSTRAVGSGLYQSHQLMALGSTSVAQSWCGVDRVDTLFSH